MGFAARAFFRISRRSFGFQNVFPLFRMLENTRWKHIQNRRWFFLFIHDFIFQLFRSGRRRVGALMVYTIPHIMYNLPMVFCSHFSHVARKNENEKKNTYVACIFADTEATIQDCGRVCFRQCYFYFANYEACSKGSRMFLFCFLQVLRLFSQTPIVGIQ